MFAETAMRFGVQRELPAALRKRLNCHFATFAKETDSISREYDYDDFIIIRIYRP